MVESIHSSFPALHFYHTLTSCSVEVPMHITAGNSTFIGEEPVPLDKYISTSIRSATSRLVSQAEQGIITFTNVLQGHNTVVLVCYTSEREPDTPTCISGKEGKQPIIQRNKFKLNAQTYKLHKAKQQCYVLPIKIIAQSSK